MEGDAPPPAMKRFVSEKEVEEARRKRQEEWEKARQTRPNLPNPDEVDPCGKTLYEQLQLNKMKKEEEFQEARKFKNQIRGLDDEESAYLDSVSRKQMQEERNRQKEEEAAINELRKQQVTNLVSVPATSELSSKPIEKPKNPPPQNAISSLLKGAVKRKADAISENPKAETGNDKSKHPIMQVIAVRPSIVSAYADSDEDGCCGSSDSSNSSSDSDDCDVSCNGKGHDHGTTDEVASFRPSIAPALMRRLRRELQGDGDE